MAAPVRIGTSNPLVTGGACRLAEQLSAWRLSACVVNAHVKMLVYARYMQGGVVYGEGHVEVGVG